MPSLTIVKTSAGKMVGLSAGDQTAWLKFRERLRALEQGEMLRIEYISPRNVQFHRKYFALLNLAFDNWNPGRSHKTHRGMPVAKNFERFRADVQILAGYYDQYFDLRGRMRTESKSIAFGSMGSDEFEKLYADVLTVLIEKVMTNYTREDVDRVVNELLDFA